MAGERTLPGLGLTGFWSPGTNGWDTGNDVNLRTLSALTHLSAISRTTVLPAGSDGDIHIVKVGETNALDVAIKDDGAWVYLTAAEGWRAWVEDDEEFIFWNGTAWAAEPGGGAVADLTDVDLTGLADGDVLVWDSAGSQWVPGEGGGGGAALSATPFHGARRGFTAYVFGSATTWTKPTLAAADHDTLSFSNGSSGFTIPAGVSRVRVSFSIRAASDGVSNQWAVYKNGSPLDGAAGGANVEVTEGGYNNSGIGGVSGALSVTEGDTISLHGYVATTATNYTGWIEVEVLEGSALSMAAAVPVTVNAQTGTSHTAALADAQALVTMDNAGANTFTLPTNAAVAFPVGTMISVKQKGAGVTTGEAPSGGTLNGVTDGSCAFSAQWATLTFTKLGTDEWTVDGLNDGIS